MELIRISNQKLKIMLTPTDMMHFDLNSDTFTDDSARMHRAFRHLLEEVRKQTDFDADDTHLSVQYFPSREGGCEMFISQLTAEVPKEHRNFPISLPPPSEEKTHLKPIRYQGGSFQRECAYRFETLDRLLLVCKRLCNFGFICTSAAYKDDREYYFLFLTLPTRSPFSTPEELDFIVEYGNIENASILRLYIREHAQIICENDALQQLSKLA